MYKDDNSKMKWRVTPNFSIDIDIKDIAILENIKDTFGVGKVRKNSSSTAVFRVDNIQELQVIVDHFYKYMGAKFSDFLLFKQCYDLIKVFPNIVPVARPPYNFNGIPDPLWISGFVSGDSTFCVSIEKSNNKIGHRVRLIFGACLHIRDKALLIGIANYFNILEVSKQSDVDFNNNILFGKYLYDSKKRENTLLQIKNYSDIVNKIIPFFNQYPILGVKA